MYDMKKRVCVCCGALLNVYASYLPGKGEVCMSCQVDYMCRDEAAASPKSGARVIRVGSMETD